MFVFVQKVYDALSGVLLIKMRSGLFYISEIASMGMREFIMDQSALNLKLNHIF